MMIIMNETVYFYSVRNIYCCVHLYFVYYAHKISCCVPLSFLYSVRDITCCVPLYFLYSAAIFLIILFFDPYSYFLPSLLSDLSSLLAGLALLHDGSVTTLSQSSISVCVPSFHSFSRQVMQWKVGPAP